VGVNMSLDKIKYIGGLLLGLVSVSACAINVGALTTEIQDDQVFVVKDLKNQEKIAKFVTTKVVEIDNPKSLNPVLGGAPQVLVSPATLFIGPGKSSSVKVYYQGPQDGKERYYQLVFSEQSMSRPSPQNEGASIEAKQKISIASILVVRPRDIKFKYQVNGKGEIKNTGNTFIQTVAVGQCAVEGKNETTPCTKEDFILPGQSADFSKKFKVFEGYGFWRGMKYEFVPAEKNETTVVMQ
jgi:Mat/Ecp fimbriae periplasmic chaperone